MDIPITMAAAALPARNLCSADNRDVNAGITLVGRTLAMACVTSAFLSTSRSPSQSSEHSSVHSSGAAAASHSSKTSTLSQRQQRVRKESERRHALFARALRELRQRQS